MSVQSRAGGGLIPLLVGGLYGRDSSLRVPGWGVPRGIHVEFIVTGSGVVMLQEADSYLFPTVGQVTLRRRSALAWYTSLLFSSARLLLNAVFCPRREAYGYDPFALSQNQYCATLIGVCCDWLSHNRYLSLILSRVGVRVDELCTMPVSGMQLSHPHSLGSDAYPLRSTESYPKLQPNEKLLAMSRSVKLR